MLESANCVELQSQCALLVGGSILVHKMLCSSLIHSLNGSLVSSLSRGLVTADDRRVKLLENGLQCRLGSLIVQSLYLCNLYTLLCRLDIRNSDPPPCS